jgi:hypothetical protein
MKTLALLSTWAFLVLAGSPNALASSAYTCATFAYPSAADTSFTGINNKGQAVGQWTESAGGPSHAFLRNTDGSTTLLSSPSGSDQFATSGINNLGQILGSSDAGTFILNPDGSHTDIAPPVAPPGHTYDSRTIQFSGINDKGELAGSVNADSNGASTLDLVFIRGTDGSYRIVDRVHSGSTPTAYAGAINNSDTVIEHNVTGLGEYLLTSDGSKLPLTLLGLPHDAEPPSTVTTALNNNSAGVGYTENAGVQSDFSYLRSLDGHYRVIVCPDEANSTLHAGGVNDRNVVAGSVSRNSPPGLVGIIATPTGVSPHVQLSTSNWTFGSHLIGEQSGPGRVFLSNTGPADLHIATIYVSHTGDPNDRGGSFRLTQSNCTVGEHFQPNTIPPGRSCFVEFVFVPSSSRWQTSTIYIPSDAPDSPQAIEVGGTGIGSTLQLSSTSWTFAAHRVGETSGNGVIYAYNPGPAIVDFGFPQIAGPDMPDFHLLNSTCGNALQPYTTCAVTFNFNPSTPGEKTASLNLTDNSERGPIQIPLSGYAF